MKKIFFLALFVSTFALLAGAVYGEESGSTDGSTLDDGSFPSLDGTIPSDPAVLQSRMQELQAASMADPGVIKAAAGLASDPDVQALANDPEVMNAAKSLDLKTLMANQKFADVVHRQRSDDQEEP